MILQLRCVFVMICTFFYCWNIWMLLFYRHDSHPKTFLNFGLNMHKLNIPANWEKCTMEIVLILTFMVYVQNAIATTLISELLSYYTPSINPYPLSRKLVGWRGFGGTEVMNTTDNRSLFYKHSLTLIPAWLSNHMTCKVWDEIIYPFPNFKGVTSGNG